MINVNLGSIEKKIKDNAALIAWLVSAYERFDGDFGRILHNYTSKDFMQNLKYAIKNPKYFLWESDHLYSSLFKAGVFAYIAVELGFIPKAWKKPVEQMLLGSGIAAMTLPGSGPAPDTSSYHGSSGGNSPSWGYKP